MKNIPETATEAGVFTTLIKALQAAGWIDKLAAEGPFTVLAPTDEAFAKIPTDTMAMVLADHAKLESILTYHVIPGKHMSTEVASMTQATTAQGSDVKIQKNDEGVWINDAKVTKADIECTNGVIHVIDTVLMPQ